MHTQSRTAFTMVELTFVIIVIGILSAIALPRFSDSADSAYYTKAKSTVVTVRNAIANERQRRVLRGDYTPITALNQDENGNASSNAFDHFSADANGKHAEIFKYPIAACATNSSRACWSVNGRTYSYRFPDASAGADGQADFVLNNNRLDCKSSDTNDCRLIIR